MGDAFRFPLRVVDGLRLEKPLRDALLPGRALCDETGRPRRLPRFFYEIPTWDDALAVKLSPNFGLHEVIQTDVREAEPLRSFPRYVPCAVTMLGLCLEQFRAAVGTFVHVAANGGYRSPKHGLTCNASPHCWGTAVNVYRIGDTDLTDRDAIERFAAIARSVLPAVWTRPFGVDPGATDDHLHLDFGYVVSVPRDAPADIPGLSPQREDAL
jgi:hypothetical protein